MLYRATYHGPHTPDGHPYETRILPTLRAVELWAQSLLSGVHVTTTRDCYHRDVGRAPSVTYRQVTRFKGAIGSVLAPCSGKRGEILPPITIVPSVGELGWTP